MGTLHKIYIRNSAAPPQSHRSKFAQRYRLGVHHPPGYAHDVTITHVNEF